VATSSSACCNSPLLILVISFCANNTEPETLCQQKCGDKEMRVQTEPSAGGPSLIFLRFITTVGAPPLCPLQGWVQGTYSSGRIRGQTGGVHGTFPIFWASILGAGPALIFVNLATAAAPSFVFFESWDYGPRRGVHSSQLTANRSMLNRTPSEGAA
jgi:hypothetical protein